MNSNAPISIKTDLLSASEIESILKLKYPNFSFTVGIPVHQELEEEEVHRDIISDNVQIFVESGLAVGLLTNIIYDISKAAFLKLNEYYREKPPMAIIKLKNGERIELPESMGEEAIKKKIEEYTLNGEYDFIRYK